MDNFYERKEIYFLQKVFLIVSLIGFSLFAGAKTMQNIAVTGVITDDVGISVPGVNVVVKGTTIGVTSDADGKYAINVPNREAVLVFSYVGFATQEKIVGNQTVINVVLNEDTQLIDEVVVVGYGVQKRATITGSVASIKGAELIKSPVTNASNALIGRIPGVIAYQRSGLP